jgi:hypothetical protein
VFAETWTNPSRRDALFQAVQEGRDTDLCNMDSNQ